MLDAPPAVLQELPGVPPGYSIEKVPPRLPLLPPPCRSSAPDDIVVCAPEQGRYRLDPALSRSPTTMDGLGAALRMRIGPLEISPQPVQGGLSQGVGVGIKLRF